LTQSSQPGTIAKERRCAGAAATLAPESFHASIQVPELRATRLFRKLFLRAL
jgi:hypothetical protein